MVLPSSGLITAAMINAELGRSATAPLNLNDSVVRGLAGVTSGGYGFNSFYGKTYEAVVTISTHTAQQNAQNYFTNADWTNAAKRKVINVTSGAHLWSYTQGVPGFRTGTGRAGELHINIGANCYILGHAGQPNAGVGGTALLLEQGSVFLTNNGGIYGGAGAGGYGGQGGTGFYYDYQNSGVMPYGRYSYNIERAGNGSNGRVFWAGSNLGDYPLVGSSYVDIGGWRYVCYSLAEVYSGYYGYSMYRQLVTPTTVYTTGGAGGAGGWGVGYNSGLTNMYTAGSPGAAGGANAGAGGYGGNGGTNWGANGSTGATGAGGNAAGGLAGQTGGLGGYYIQNSGYLAGFTNTGTVLGRIV